MANGYLGETPVVISESEFKDYNPSDWAMYYITRYSGIDGSHHKDWLLDQVARILKGSEITVVLARWESGTEEYRVNVGEPSQEYKDWAQSMLGDWDENEQSYEYEYDTGIAP